MGAYKTYRRHNCGSAHRTWLTAAKCIWPRAIWIHEHQPGGGRYAVLAYCRGLTVSLWNDPDAAEDGKAFIDRFACGGACTRRHEIVELADSVATGIKP